MKKSIHNQKPLKPSRKVLSNNSTSAEAVFWNLIKKRQIEGRKFRRQHSIDNYIVDFYCAEEQLIIELDGAGHYTIGGEAFDEFRDAHLTALGLKILRFENYLIFEDIELVLKEIKKCFVSSS